MHSWRSADDTAQVNLLSRAMLYSQERPIFGLSRHRMGIDGKGVTTLVALMGCPLRCRYCLNNQCHRPVYAQDAMNPVRGIRVLSPQALYDVVKKDNIYFQTTGGGICFGGGEPTLQADFIIEFAKLCPRNWKLTIETSLHCTSDNIKALASYIDQWIVDIKDMNPCTYEAYTGVVSRLAQSLDCLQACVPEDRVIVKVPLIPDFNTEADVRSSVECLRKRGFQNIMETQYVKSIARLVE